jgi:hypothetical protein
VAVAWQGVGMFDVVDLEPRSSRTDIDHLVACLHSGFVASLDRYVCAEQAWEIALEMMQRADAVVGAPCSGSGVDEIGRFLLPPAGVVQRDFQVLHVDFGIPRATSSSVPLARFTALYVDPSCVRPDAATRIVRLDSLLAQRTWPSSEILIDRLSNAANASAVEGILARLIEAVDASADLTVKETPGFLCGMEFGSIEDERGFFAAHGLDLGESEQAVVLEPGQLLVVDNLAVAHGRTGRRGTGELHQLCVGNPSVDLAGQRDLLRSFVQLFATDASTADSSPAASRSGIARQACHRKTPSKRRIRYSSKKSVPVVVACCQACAACSASSGWTSVTQFHS